MAARDSKRGKRKALSLLEKLAAGVGWTRRCPTETVLERQAPVDLPAILCERLYGNLAESFRQARELRALGKKVKTQ